MTIRSTSWTTTHAALREALLERITATLVSDGRFVAAWLIGSFGRGEEDAYSDIDLVAVVAPPHADALCARLWQSAGRSAPASLRRCSGSWRQAQRNPSGAAGT